MHPVVAIAIHGGEKLGEKDTWGEGRRRKSGKVCGVRTYALFLRMLQFLLSPQLFVKD